MPYRVLGPTPYHPIDVYASEHAAIVEAFRRIRIPARTTIKGDVEVEMGLGFERVCLIERALDRFRASFEGVRISIGCTK